VALGLDSSRAAFNEKLNWDAWAISVKKLIEESGLVRKKRARRGW
jgi:hypothetical protein